LYFSVYSLVFVSIEKIYQTLDEMNFFHRLSKHLEFRQKYSLRVLFSTLFSVFGHPDETLSFVFDILPQSSSKIPPLHVVYSSRCLDILNVTLLISALLPVCEEVRSNLRPGDKKEPDSPTLPYPERLDSTIAGSSTSLNTEHQVSIVITTDDNPGDQAFAWPSECQNMLLDPGIVNDTQTQALLLTTLVREMLRWFRLLFSTDFSAVLLKSSRK